MNPLGRSKLARQKLNFSVSFNSKNQKDFTYLWSINCYGNIWASGSGAVGFRKCCSLLDSTVFFSSWSLTVFSPYSTQKVYTCSLHVSTFSSPKGIYMFFADSKEVKLSLLLFHCLATNWLSFSLTTLPAYPFLL